MSATYGISALRVTDGQEPRLVRYRTAADLEQLDEVTAEFRADFANQPDVRVDVDTLR